MELARLPLRRIACVLPRHRQHALVLMLVLSMLGLLALFSASYEQPARVVSQLMNLASHRRHVLSHKSPQP